MQTISRAADDSLEKLLENFKYKPGWMFSIESTVLRITAKVADADNPMYQTTVVLYETIPPDYHKINWMHWLRDKIIKFEIHEVDEFFQVKGHKVFDPH